MRLSEIEPVIGATRLDVTNWLARMSMTSAFEEVVSGQARHFSYQNTVELALIAAFITAGLNAARAVVFARPLVQQARAPGVRVGPTREWIVLAAGNDTKFNQTDKLDLAKLQSTLGQTTPPVFALINVAEVFRRVDALFGKAA